MKNTEEGIALLPRKNYDITELVQTFSTLDFDVSTTQERLDIVKNICSSNNLDYVLADREDGGLTKSNPSTKDLCYSQTNVSDKLCKVADYLLMTYDKELKDGASELVEYCHFNTGKEDENNGRNLSTNDLESFLDDNIDNYGNAKYVSDAIVMTKDDINKNPLLDNLYLERLFVDCQKRYYEDVDKYDKNFISYVEEKMKIAKNVNSNFYIYINGVAVPTRDYYIFSMNELIKNYPPKLDYGTRNYKLNKIVEKSKLFSRDYRDAKIGLLNFIGFNSVSRGDNHKSYDEIDLTDFKVVKELLRVQNCNLSHDLGLEVYYLNILLDKIKTPKCYNRDINKVDLTPREKLTLEMYRHGEATQQDIANELLKQYGLNVTYQQISRDINTICKKISKAFETDVWDWLHIEYRRGTYKKCTRCEKIKLTSEFRKDRTKLDGFESWCKTCRGV